jgi:predicted RecB family nuclease
MKTSMGQIRLSASDLSNHLACRHVTTLDLEVARGLRAEPERRDPDLAVIIERGERHEKAYLDHLAAKGLIVESLAHIDLKEEGRLLSETLVLMESGAQVIAQGALTFGEWFGRPDVLKRVETRCAKWKWSYEAVDTKLARETKGATILQLSLYSNLLKEVQGTLPEFFWVVPSGTEFLGEKYRVEEYAAYYRCVQRRLLKSVRKEGVASTYPEPVEHCDVCKWFAACNGQRRGDDHLSFVAGIRRQQRDQLLEWNAPTMAKLAALPIPIKERPSRGSKASYERVREQARIQVDSREKQTLIYERLLPPIDGMGLCRLPLPSKSDMFVDLEGDSFVGKDGLRYLFGFVALDDAGGLKYEKRWALDQASEKAGFEWLVDEIFRRREADSQMHVYHFGAYEPSTLRKLMGLHSTREDEIDRMLRAGMFVDLHLTFKQSTRASLEEYSLKKIEAFYDFKRKVSPEESRAAMRFVEHGLELERLGEDIPERFRDALEGYNGEDCLSAAMLRGWLEEERKKLEDDGLQVPRFCDHDEKGSDDVEEQQTRILELAGQLTKDLPQDSKNRTPAQQTQWLLAQLLDWHRRDAKPGSWRYFDLRGMDDSDLLEEKDAVSGLQWIESVFSPDGSRVDRYSFPNQETSVRASKKKEVHYRNQRIGTVVDMNSILRTIDIKRGGDDGGFHPTSIFVKEPYRNPKAQQDSLYRLGCWVRDNGLSTNGPWQSATNFLFRKPPRLLDRESLTVSDTEEFSDELTRIVGALDSSVLAVQGPPGSGKTTSAARAIDRLVSEKKMRIGVTALSHSVIRHLLKTIGDEGSCRVRCMHKSDEKYDGLADGIQVTTTNGPTLKALRQGSIDVLGGTAFLWAREEFANSVDVLFVDEASQVSLADVLAISQAARSVVLIGDPQQLARPGDAAHPPGAEVSSLEHLLIDTESGKLKTMPQSLGLFIDETKRLHPRICKFTSNIFYEGRLASHGLTQNRLLDGHPWINGAGLWFVPVEHEGNQNSSIEEVEVIARIVDGLLQSKVIWFRGEGRPSRLKKEDILIVAPYNAQVSDLGNRFPEIAVGTVDKFQGKQGAIVIYSLTTSSPEEAPRGMEFLYSLNRLNVATSRAMTAVIVVGSPRLFEPECRTPRQMQLANALCAYREMAVEVDPRKI